MLKLRYMTAALALAAAGIASPAYAATPCTINDITPAATDCAGFVDGNVLNDSAAAEAQTTALLAELGFVYNGDADGIEAQSPLNGATIVNFATTLIGQTIVGIHFGNGAGGPGNATAFYLFDAGAGLTSLTLNYAASSNIILYQTGTAVPEPGTWAMMLLGFGIAGFAIRRRRKTSGLLAAVA
jgi:hypothetical protein